MKISVISGLLSTAVLLPRSSNTAAAGNRNPTASIRALFDLQLDRIGSMSRMEDSGACFLEKTYENTLESCNEFVSDQEYITELSIPNADRPPVYGPCEQINGVYQAALDYGFNSTCPFCFSSEDSCIVELSLFIRLVDVSSDEDPACVIPYPTGAAYTVDDEEGTQVTFELGWEGSLFGGNQICTTAVNDIQCNSCDVTGNGCNDDCSNAIEGPMTTCDEAGDVTSCAATSLMVCFQLFGDEAPQDFFYICESQAPSMTPSASPSVSPSASPSVIPSSFPSKAPTTDAPSKAPTDSPTNSPSKVPTEAPTNFPSKAPTTDDDDDDEDPSIVEQIVGVITLPFRLILDLIGSIFDAIFG